MNLYNVFPEVEAMVFSSDVTDHVAPNQIRMKQGEKKTSKHQMANKVLHPFFLK